MSDDGNGTPEPTDGRGFGLSRDAWGRLVLIDAEGVRHVGVESIRAFPLSDPGRWVSLCDAEGCEIARVPDIQAAPAPIRQLLEEDLAQREFVPVVLRIVRVSSDAAPADWDVETDRGPTRFLLNSDDDVRRLGPQRVLITDARGIRYHVPDTRTLDANSRRLLERFL